VLWQFNTIRNLPYLLANPGVVALDNAFPGKPAIIVGAGPSLNETLPFLKASREGFVVIATATSLRALRKAGIAPDLVVAVDAHPLTASQFATPCEDLYLACSTLVFPPAIPKFRGIFSGTMSANPIDAWLSRIIDPLGELLAAGTVTSTAVNLAVKMGCNPVVSVGFDLSLKDDGTTHASHTMYHGVKVKPDYHELTHVPGNYRDRVLTTHQFKNYIDLMVEYLPLHPEVQFVNATNAGARIAGMRLVHPEALVGFAAPSFDAREVIVARHRAKTQDNRFRVKDDLKKAMLPLELIVKEGREAAYLCNRLIMLLRAPQSGDEDAAREIIRRLEEIDQSLMNHQDASLLIEMSLWPASHELSARRPEEEMRLDKAVLANRRWREFYEQIAGAAQWTRDLLDEVMDELEGKPEQQERKGEEKAQYRERELALA
jgi:hypothetical protein